MAIIAEAKGESTIPKMENGTYPARCYQMIELGTQEGTFEGKATKPKKKVMLVFEIPSETYEIERDGIKETRIRTANKEFALSMHEKSTLRKFLAAWRGKDFTDSEARKFDVTVLLGKCCLLSIETNEKGYPTITGAAKLIKGMSEPEQVNKTQVLSFDSWNQPLFESLHEYVRKKIEASPEHTKLVATKDKRVLDHVPDPVDEDPMPF